MAQKLKREQIDLLLETTDLSTKEIAEKLGVSVSTVYLVKSRKSRDVGLGHGSGGGRPRKFTKSTMRCVTQQIRRKPYLSLRTLAQIAPGKPSYETVRRNLKEMKYSKIYPTNSPMVSEKNRQSRIQWAKKHKYPKSSWFKTVFIDEMSIWLSRGRIQMWTKSGKKRVAPTTKHAPKINVWAGFSSMGTFPLCVFTTNMDSLKFIEILEGHLLEQAKVFHQDDWRLVMDNDPKHTSKIVRAFIDKNVPMQLPWPSQSPDLNPIENLFAWVKRELIKKGPRTISELKRMLEDTWSGISSEFLQPYCQSMPERCKMVIASEGFPINY